MLFFNFSLFYFSKLKMTIVKRLMEKPSFSIIDFEGSYEVLLGHRYFWSTHFWHWKDGHFYGTAFYFFLNEKNIATSLLVIRLKCTVVYYANLNSSSINKPYLQAVEYTISFLFLFLIYVYFNEAFVKNFLKNYYFLIEISKIHLKM